MKIVVVRRMYDPVVRKSWLQAFTLEADSEKEFEAELAKLNARHPRWKGRTPHG